MRSKKGWWWGKVTVIRLLRSLQTDALSAKDVSVTKCLNTDSFPLLFLKPDADAVCVDRVDTVHAVAPPVGHFPGDRVVLSCRPGYRPEGDMTSLCQENRTWTAPAGSCVSKFAVASDEDTLITFFFFLFSFFLLNTVFNVKRFMCVDIQGFHL